MAHIGLEPIDGQNHSSLRGEAFLQALPAAEMQRHQFLITVHEMFHRPLTDLQSLFVQDPLHLWR